MCLIHKMLHSRNTWKQLDLDLNSCGLLSCVSAVPALCRFIILACDGLFKVFSADEAVKFVLGVLQVSARPP